ncbi:motile sperm domain-containing protein 1 [Nilaparvata lugens]|uniref:motile sperm domain-containing protein 1 n=1 Tax=Nilaparvata lugens TaxID=108931 RepID=UPI00193D2B9C|nr:motile sperm domain-containing protein 1 [Nilaparvata lugens]XP_039289920.1 motile sperm domain-containing protein 1 [Nilaparvata lugens]XP_039289923.1 motile sperm domain-containing protein 1 [Nilaparvata lugens]
MQPGTQFDGKLPVFIFPTSIVFYLEDKTSHKQVLTLYNPYDFVISFRVLCTAPRKYTVVDSEGTVKSQCCIDIVIRHNAVSLGNCNVTDKFRIQVRDHSTKQVIGKRDMTATLCSDRRAERERVTPDPDSFQSMPTPSDAPGKPNSHQYPIIQKTGPARTNNLTAIIIGVLCMVALLCPTEGESSVSSFIAFHLSVTIKLIASYVLGK